MQVDGWTLVDAKTGVAVKASKKVKTFRGESAKIEAGHPPRHSGSEGHVTTNLGYHYAGVYGLKWVR